MASRSCVASLRTGPNRSASLRACSLLGIGPPFMVFGADDSRITTHVLGFETPFGHVFWNGVRFFEHPAGPFPVALTGTGHHALKAAGQVAFEHRGGAFERTQPLIQGPRGFLLAFPKLVVLKRPGNFSYEGLDLEGSGDIL